MDTINWGFLPIFDNKKGVLHPKTSEKNPQKSRTKNVFGHKAPQPHYPRFMILELVFSIKTNQNNL